MKRYFLIVIALALGVAAAEWMYGMHLAGGAFVYPLDDAYIHLAIARSLAENGTWGFESGVPVFASSSPLWTLVLALFVKTVGFHEWLPLALSYVFSGGAVFLAFALWRRAGLDCRIAGTAGLVMVAVMPVTTLANLGMEHALHVFCLEWFVLCAWSSLQDEPLSGRFRAMLIVSSMLAVGARYESLFVITPVAVLLFCRRRFRIGILLLVSEFVPVVSMGFYALANSRPFIPVSLLLKTDTCGSPLLRGIFSLYCGIAPDSIHFHLLILVLLAMTLLPRTPRPARELAFILALAAGGHGIFARLGWLYRYEVYLLALGFSVLPLVFINREKKGALSVIGGIHRDFVRRYAGLLLVLGIASPFAIRSFKAQCDTVLAQREINAQQRQMSRIFQTMPEQNRGPVAVSDLGCVALYSGVHVLDLWGLGSPDVAEMILKGGKTPEKLSRLFARHGVRYFALYTGWYDLSLLAPASIVVAHLDLTHPNVVCSGSSVMLGVVDPTDAPSFRSHLELLRPSLPPGAKLTIL